jgi:chaperonin GroEL
MIKKIYKYEDIKDKIIHAVDTITDPVRQTLSPKGGNVIYEDDKGDQRYTNDGYTIISSISVADAVENAIIEILKGGSRKTNIEAGDGTSSTLLMSSILIKEGLRLIENGHNQMDIRDNLIKFAEDMKSELSKRVIKVKDDSDIKFIARISAGNDEQIASNVAKIIKVVGQDGQVMIDRGFGTETEIIEDTGFFIRSGVFAEELANKQLQTSLLDVPVLITDKRLYYKAEAETILKTVLDAGYSEVVIIAQDFLGEAISYFVANHVNNKIKVILIAEKKLNILEDLAIYLGGEVVSDRKGSLVDKVTIDDFVLSKKVFSDPSKSILSRDKKEVNSGLDKRIAVLRREMKKVGNKQDPEYLAIERRISSLTAGMVTIKVGGSTPLEIIEKAHRYEDAINASRCALREGYLPGAGVAMWAAWTNIKTDPDYERMFKGVAEANIRQIAINCGEIPEMILERILTSQIAYDRAGYNANTGKIEDMIKAGIIEPFIVTKQVIANAVSIANVILTSRYLIVNDLEEINKDKK